jgi:hypothetical protein
MVGSGIFYAMSFRHHEHLNFTVVSAIMDSTDITDITVIKALVYIKSTSKSHTSLSLQTPYTIGLDPRPKLPYLWVSDPE